MQISQEISEGSSEIKSSSQDINNSVNMIKDASGRVVNDISNVKIGLDAIKTEMPKTASNVCTTNPVCTPATVTSPMRGPDEIV